MSTKISKLNPFNETKGRDEKKVVYRSHPYLFYQLKPSQKIGELEINTHGYRGKNIEKNKDKIVIFGNSTLFGSGVKDHETISSYLNTYLPNYDVINTGMSGYTMQQEFYLFYYEVLKNISNIKYVVFFDGYTEALHTFLNKEINYPPYYFITKSNEKLGKMCISNYLKYFLMRINNKFLKKKLEKENPTLEEFSGNYFHYISLIKDICKQRGISPIFIIQPSMHYAVREQQFKLDSDLKVNYDKIESKYTGFTQYIVDIYKYLKLKKSDIVFMGDLFDNNLNKYYLDQAHYSPLGNKLIAEKIYTLLKEDKTYNDSVEVK